MNKKLKSLVKGLEELVKQEIEFENLEGLEKDIDQQRDSQGGQIAGSEPSCLYSYPFSLAFTILSFLLSIFPASAPSFSLFHQLAFSYRGARVLTGWCF